MANYHINDSDEVKLCRANLKCRFGGYSGSENHFSSREDAEKELQKKLEKLYGDFNLFKKSDLKERQARTGEILKGFKNSGLRVKHISSVTDHNFEKAINPNVSNIDVLDEKPSSELLDQLRSGNYQLF